MKLHLTIFRTGKAILSTEAALTPDMMDRLREAWREFVENADQDLLIISEGSVRVIDLELEDGELVIQ